jgi:hypothetical protein
MIVITTKRRRQLWALDPTYFLRMQLVVSCPFATPHEVMLMGDNNSLLMMMMGEGFGAKCRSNDERPGVYVAAAADDKLKLSANFN